MCDRCDKALEKVIAANERHRALVKRLHGEEI